MEVGATRQGHIEVGGLRIDYVEAGTGEPVVLLDGWRGGLSALHDEMAKHYRTISFQLQKTDPPQELARGMAGVIRSLVDVNYTLVGSSRGADVAAWLAVQAGDILDALVLLSPMAIRPRMQDATHDVELEARLGGIQCPTLVVFGTDDRLVSREAAGVYAGRIPNVNVSLVYDAGHLIAADRPEKLASLVMDYVGRRDTFVVGRGGSPNTL